MKHAVIESEARVVRQVHEHYRIRSRRRTIQPTLMQGLVSCRRCGYALSRTSTRSSARLIHYYRCIGSDAWRHPGGPRCDSRPVRQDLLDEIVWTEVIRLLEDPSLIEDIAERQRIVRLVVKEVLVDDDTIVIRHCIPVPSGPPNGSTRPRSEASDTGR